MYYDKYLKNFDSNSFTEQTFLISLVVFIIIFLVLSRLIWRSKRDQNIFEKFLNTLLFIVYSFLCVTIFDYNYNFDKSKFWFSNLKHEKRINNQYQILVENTENSTTPKQIVEHEGETESIEIPISNILETELRRLEKDPDYIKTAEKLVEDDYSEHGLKEVCGYEDGKCEWCGKIFPMNKYYKSALIVFSSEVAPGFMFSDEDWNTPLAYKTVMDYKKGIKYQCLTEKQKFCSKKCERESYLYSN